MDDKRVNRPSAAKNCFDYFLESGFSITSVSRQPARNGPAENSTSTLESVLLSYRALVSASRRACRE